ncbi:hypothetical protein ABEB36_014234 [Hypothenemus hampei]|uniref:RETREG1-3/ARL6IP-like N-terminal reticulon-homology domain-containing protein n=1 Tax=Hypothenemus hampei TaxID=57062 RepID=A0ABD1E8B0_HYPHA
MSENETQMRKLKLSLEPWRELILQSNSVLLWEKQYHASTILAGSTMFFTFLWFWEPTLLTAFALLGFTFTLSDFLLPYILSTIYSAENWTPDKQKQYEEICTNIILYQTKAELLVSSYYRLRVTNRKLYFGITASTLIFLAWLGNIVDNLLLTYIVVTFLLMVPGMQRHGMLNKVWENVSKLFTELVENAKVRVGHKQE